MSKLSEALERAEDAEAALQDVSAVEAHCAHVVVQWVGYPGGQVGLDAAGTMVRVELDGLYGWFAE